MIVSFIPGAKVTLLRPYLLTGFKIKATPYTGPGKKRYVRLTGSQLKLVELHYIGGVPIQNKHTYLVDLSLLQIH